jgi:hypothetical protein
VIATLPLSDRPINFVKVVLLERGNLLSAITGSLPETSITIPTWFVQLDVVSATSVKGGIGILTKMTSPTASFFPSSTLLIAALEFVLHYLNRMLKK